MKLLKFFKKIDRIEAIILAIVLVPHIYISAHNAGTVLDWFNTDDAFYYFVPARNIVAGLGGTFDGISLTNGFHPLWMLICIPVFALAQIDMILPLRVIILVLAVLHAATGIILYRFTKDYLKHGIAALVGIFWVLSPAIHSLTTKGGIESGLNAFFIALFLYKLSQLANQGYKNDRTISRITKVGIIAAFVLFARLDNAFLISWGGMWLLYRWWHASVAGSSSPKEIMLFWIRTGTAYSAPAAASLLVYTAWNKLTFDVFLPISGSIKVWWGTLPFTVYGTSEFKHGNYSALLNHLFSGDSNWGPWSLIMAPINSLAEYFSSIAPNIYPILSVTNFVYAICALMLLVIALLFRAFENLGFKRIFNLGLIPLLLAALSQIGYYNLRASLAQRHWYWVLEAVFMVLLGAVILEIIYKIMMNGENKIRTTKKSLTLTMLAATVLLATLHADYLKTSLRDPSAYDNHFYIERARWLENNTEPNSVIAMTGAGAISYFTSGRTIVNMDGLMNNAEYFQHLQQGNGAIYLEKQGVDYIFGKPSTILGSSPYVQMLNDRTVEVSVYSYYDRDLFLWRFIP